MKKKTQPSILFSILSKLREVVGIFSARQTKHEVPPIILYSPMNISYLTLKGLVFHFEFTAKMDQSRFFLVKIPSSSWINFEKGDI